MLKASDLRAGHGDRTIFDGLSLALPTGRRAGLVGPNGAGKSTLLALLAGAAAPERGSVTVGPGDRVGHLPQEPPGAGLTIDRLLGAALGEVWALRAELARLEPRLHEAAALAAYGEAQERFDALGGWALQARLDGARDALGIAHVPLDAPLGELSGGEAARALLAGVLLAEPTILLLDEPTNHLDLDGLAWLEAFLAGFGGTVLVVSHDRRFLDATVTEILELEDGELRAYEGGYSAYRDEKAARRARTALAYEAQQKRHRRLEADIRATRGQALHTELTVSRAAAPRLKRYAKKVAAKASAREHRLQRELDSDEHIAKPRRTPALKVELEGAGGGHMVAALRAVDGGWDGEPLLRGVDLAIHGRDRIALTGPNGAGKSTLLALLDGSLEPLAGSVERPVVAATLPQTADALPADRSATDYVRERAPVGEGEARRLLGHFGLEGAAALRPLSTLSPGERARTAIAAIVAARAELLLLDEPTNHLDLPCSRCSRARCATTRERSSPPPTTARSSRRSAVSGGWRSVPATWRRPEPGSTDDSWRREDRWIRAELPCCAAWPTRSPSPAGRRRWTSSTWTGLSEAAQRAFDSDPAGTTAYGTSIGYVPLREYIAEQHGVAAEQVLVTNGSMQADAFLFERSSQTGDARRRRVADVRPHAAEPARPRGRHPDGRARDRRHRRRRARGRAATAACARRSRTSSPTSRTRPATRSRATSARSCWSSPPSTSSSSSRTTRTSSIRFEGEGLPTMLSQDEGDRVVYASSFSKTVCPGIRVGYLVGPAGLIKTIQGGRRTPTSRRTWSPSRS